MPTPRFPVTGDHKLRPKSGRTPLQPLNSQANHVTDSSSHTKPAKQTQIEICIADQSNKENTLHRPTQIESLDASLAEELSAIRKKMERLRSDRERTEKMLRRVSTIRSLREKEQVKKSSERQSPPNSEMTVEDREESEFGDESIIQSPGYSICYSLQVGDVVLIQDESVMENEFKMVGLETLVGYKVVTPARRNIGKVRGYSFNINSGAIESLELDSFGISIIPSSLVSTYALFVEDVLEVIPDAVVVHEAAASRIQRLTKGFLGTQNVGTSVDELGEYPDFERPARSEYGQSVRRSYGSQRFQPKNRETEDDWELPKDYL
ncbi:hypothetical protein CFP56_006733 [Quercus suber]|uniref:PRC-barrel domain-containing protein n=1 Tax=Quercus suber TaxID=58331 RepID=A0AAW0L6H7_QUESU